MTLPEGRGSFRAVSPSSGRASVVGPAPGKKRGISRCSRHRSSTTARKRSTRRSTSSRNTVTGAKVLAGGQSLIPLMKLRFAAPARLIDVNWIRGLDGIEERDGTLHIGALVRHNKLAASDATSERFPTTRPRP